MDPNTILQIANDDLYDDFIEQVLTTPTTFRPTIEELERSERFSNDFIFRIHVQTAKQFVEVVSLNHAAVQEAAEELIERSTTLELYELVNLNYHIFAISSKQIGHFEKALHGFFYIIHSERLHGLHHLTSMAYFYIGEIYLNHGEMQLANKYLNLSLEVLESTKDSEPRYHTKKKLCSGLLVQVLYYTGQFDKMSEHVQIIQDDSENNPASLYSARLALLFYHFSRKEFDRAKKVFYKILELFAPDDKESRLQVIKVLCVLSREYELPYSYIEDELLLAETCGESQLQYVNYVLHYALFEYYLDKGEKDGAYRHLVKSHKGIEKSMESLYSEKVVNFQFIERSFSIQEDISKIQRKNNELKMIAEESIRNRRLAESISNRLRLVNELGKRLTRSLDMQGVIETVYQALLSQIPLDNFLIMIKDQESNILRTIVFYEKGELKENIAIDADTERSAFVETFQSNRRIVIHDYHTETRFHRPTTNLQKSARSVLFLPISIENKVLGACSVQHMQPHVYTQDHIDFLEDLMPYLAIALNNAFKSAALENEIERRRKTQEELKLANRRLEMLSYLDGLTQISNRRDFENRVLDYLGRSMEKGLLISIFMFDIDFFKRFNDTYGHLAGDEALKSVATIVHKHFEAVEGISARFGGEEFVAACLGLDEEQSVSLGNRIREDVLALGIANENTPLGTLSISVGIALSSGAEPTQKSALMRWADLSLYQAKTSGKNRVVSKTITSDDSATAPAPNRFDIENYDN